MTKRKKFRFVVKGDFEIEVDCVSQHNAEELVANKLAELGCSYATFNASPSRDWQVLNGGVKRC